MKILTQSLMLAALFGAGSALAADAPKFDVLNSMSVAQFRSAGLDKLTDAQLKALNGWFNQYLQQQGPACGASPGSSTAMPVAPGTAATPAGDSITAHIQGSFNGWRGDTQFTLDNGQVWQQVDDSMVTVGRVDHPKVTITRGLLSAYYMSVEGMTDTVEVRRIKP